MKLYLAVITTIVAVPFLPFFNSCQKAKSPVIDPAAQYPDSVAKYTQKLAGNYRFTGTIDRPPYEGSNTYATFDTFGYITIKALDFKTISVNFPGYEYTLPIQSYSDSLKQIVYHHEAPYPRYSPMVWTLTYNLATDTIKYNVYMIEGHFVYYQMHYP